MDDLISRQAAIDAVKELCLHYTPTKSVKHPHIDFVVEELERLPSAHQRWIPCSERLPEEDEDVLVCSEEGDIDIACWLPEQWTDEPHIEWWSGEYRVYAVAWMPLPKPYGGENE